MNKSSENKEDILQFETTTEDERLKMMRNKRKRRRQIQLGVFIGVILLVILIVLYMFTDISKVDQVDIKGEEIVAKKDINKALNIKSDSRIYNLPISDMKTKIEKLEGVKSVTIKRHFPNDMTVEVTEYEPIGLIKNKKGYVPLLENGSTIKNLSTDLPIDVPILNDFSSKKLDKLIPELKKVKPKVKAMISEVNYKPGENNQNRIQLFMTDNVEVVGDIQTFANKINYYPSISDKLERDNSGALKTPGFVDLQVGVTFLPYETKEQQSERSEKEAKQDESAKTEQKKLDQALQDLSKELDKSGEEPKSSEKSQE
ncbi:MULTISPECIES: cell division protein FtsQ/DivIB [Mammaliicoccus]|uniref:Cell division protein DivIB n=1 Tax=Mammaliicoccus fleurettii TaxID=150056 RepID=A0ABS5MKT0_9STAP|nr:FtsQ-type POTRA domain-containing protein [Mammaliicoccus fleurettii]MBL0846491.1 FtsQ-type POTRA domain-containing protein [Mammaliicoccus fleurettii]MBO3062905.1 FtsQ-type POTRA domain-containing protein [Mammaliicoccus fleurettii]MBS3670932.1 FtsQ-type POTRA domain-containing protein [Mammaliicoccus fleurettii]MBS3695991.1 FtsQ-type POTRA domain-containing protein [Mammaliicoccus fleurettii]MEB7723568.1 FtsQ-type POTRA domain-containing protein [Mammaliicoccus fleurettii]